MTKVIRFDWAMKTILRDKSNFDILEGFIGALLEDDEIKILELLESESNQDEEFDKFNRVDLLVEDSQHRKIIIEIQNSFQVDYLQRILYGSSKVIVENQKLGDSFQEISKVISISILYFNLGPSKDYLYHGEMVFKEMNTLQEVKFRQKVLARDEKTGEIKQKLEEKDIFPEYYFIIVNRYPNVLKRKIDEWVYMFKNNEVGDNFTSKNIDKAKQRLVELNMTAEQKERYKKYLSNVADINSSIQSAEEKGFFKGLAKGIEEGIEKGLQEGKLEEKLAIARNMKKLNLSVEAISQVTRLSQAEIENLD